MHRVTVQTRDFASLELLLEDFQKRALQASYDLNNGNLIAAALGVAGAIVGDSAVSNNLPWTVNSGSVAGSVGLSRQRTLLLNDLVASASSLAHLQPGDWLKLNDGNSEPRAPKALIAAGTGLGEAILFWDGSRYRVSPSD